MSVVKELSTKCYEDRPRWFGNLVREIAHQSDWRITNQEQLEEMDEMLDDILIYIKEIQSELRTPQKMNELS